MDDHGSNSHRKAVGSAKAALVFAAALLLSSSSWGCALETSIRSGTAEELGTYFKSGRVTVVTFLGYSGAEYEDKPAMLAAAASVLDRFSPNRTIVNIGATAEGIGAVYGVAKEMGFRTAGIVSTQAREANVPLSACVDIVFYVADARWGGIEPGTGALSPTSAAMVRYSDVLIAIGGGEIARDEMLAAQRAGKRTQFIAADMNHGIAVDKALKKGQAPPADFSGAAAAAFR